VNNYKVHNFCVGTRHRKHAEIILKTEDQRKGCGGGKHWVKHQKYTCIINAKAKIPWAMNTHLNNKGQEWKTIHTNRSSAILEGVKEEDKKVNMDDIISIQDWM
jgi:hypothetical protein